ncbi:MAG: hypothetical protein EZS26_001016 [Candidatus Ordinivivax streblomastigis]|uniref:Uncharacterized protein n=1 Tax=Candidatus Ordinivivax streblomastigis TaxID=2540710 RepID=A0A5M8P3E7_9BACT|nr:MAG: hypothetical protein EZS26_001016 [Candidatus Ordinivivax streblomastigis]
MKNKRQVLSYLTMVRIVTEKDELAIESYLSRRSIILKLNKFSKTDDAVIIKITFEEFVNWFESGMPDRNEVIVEETSGTTGIIKGFSVNAIILGVSLTACGDLVTSEVKLENTTYRNANTEEKFRLQKALNEKKMAWNNSNSKLLSAVKPVENLYLRVALLGERVAIGVFREINDKGEIVMYCLKENDKPVRYSLYETIGNYADYQLEPVSAQERNMLALELKKIGKIWNGHAKRIEPLHFRVAKGEVYYYIDDLLEIITTTDKEKPKDLKRLHSGNYFHKHSDAKDMLDLMIKKRKEQLINFTEIPETKKNRKIKKNNSKNELS